MKKQMQNRQSEGLQSKDWSGELEERDRQVFGEGDTSHPSARTEQCETCVLPLSSWGPSPRSPKDSLASSSALLIDHPRLLQVQWGPEKWNPRVWAAATCDGLQCVPSKPGGRNPTPASQNGASLQLGL